MEHNGQSKTTELANKVEKTIKKETRETKLEVEENETEDIKLLGYSFFQSKINRRKEKTVKTIVWQTLYKIVKNKINTPF